MHALPSGGMASIDQPLVGDHAKSLPKQGARGSRRLPPRGMRHKYPLLKVVLDLLANGILSTALSTFLPAPFPDLIAAILMECWTPWIWPWLRRVWAKLWLKAPKSAPRKRRRRKKKGRRRK